MSSNDDIFKITMIRYNNFFKGFLLSFLVIAGTNLMAQEETKTDKQADTTAKADTTAVSDEQAAKQKSVEQYKEEATFLVQFLEGTLNALGDPELYASEKTVIIEDTYAKLFQSDKVQIEDDLDPARATISNKDVQAYLKDIEFFFEKAEFKFIIEDVSEHVTDNGQLYFVVSLNRKLNATTVKGDSIDDSKERFIEINLDDINKELKIASIYTTKLSLDEELIQWWNKVPQEWKTILGKDVKINDELPITSVKSLTDSLMTLNDNSEIPLDTQIFANIKGIMDTETLDISGQDSISDLQPLVKLKKLKYLNISKTAVTDLMPLRSLTLLEELRLDNTDVETLAPLKYCSKIKVISCKGTPISEIDVVSNFAELQSINLKESRVSTLNPLATLTDLNKVVADGSAISSIAVLAGLENLTTLNINNTAVASLSGLDNLTKLERLNIEGTTIKDLTAVSKLPKFKILFADESAIGNLDALKSSSSIERIYCDGSNVTQSIAQSFMKAKPNCLVIYDSEQLRSWWNKMPSAWKNTFKKYEKVSSEPTKDELQRIANITAVNIEGNTEIKSLEPLANLVNLKELKANGSGISDLTPLSKLQALEKIELSKTLVTDLQPVAELSNLTSLDVSHTNIRSIQPLQTLQKLQRIDIQSTKVNDLSVINSLGNLQYLNCDNSTVNVSEGKKFSKQHPNTLVIFNTNHLKGWWSKLSADWKKVFVRYAHFSGEPSAEILHKIAKLEVIDISGDKNIKDLSPLHELYLIKELYVSDTRINNISAVSPMKSLEKLACDNTPIADFNSVSSLSNLKMLDISGTLVEEIDFLANLKSLEDLRMSGNSYIKSVKPLSSSKNLKHLDISNTSVKTLKYIYGLKGMKTLKCFKSKLKSSRVRDFKKNVPNCEVDFY